MKKRLAALLAGVMVVTSLPVASFAASDNRVTKVPTVKSDYKFNDVATAPTLRIQEKDNDWNGNDQTIRLKFENAKWTAGNAGTYTSEVGTFTYKKITDTLVEVVLNDTASQKDVVEIPLLTEVTGEGDVKVTVDSLDSAVSSGTYTFAVAGSGSTKTTVDGTVDLVDSKAIKPIVIDELKVGTIGSSEKITLTLPSGFEFANESATVEVGSGFSGQSVTKSVSYGEYNGKTDKEILEISLTDLPTVSARGSVIIKDVTIRTTDDSEYGDIVLKVSGDDITTEEVKVAKYVQYGVSVKAENKDVPELLSGRYEVNGINQEDDAHKLLKVIIEENVPESWWASRKTEIELPEEVKVIKVKADKTNNIAAEGNISLNSDRNKITLTNWEVKNNEKGKVELAIWVSADANFEGDIVATVGGSGLPEETELVLGKAIAPIKVTGEQTDVNVGYKEVEIGAIEVAEAKAGALQKGGYIFLSAESMNFGGTIKAEVTEGDLKLGDVKKENGMIKIEVKRASSAASTIKVTGAKVDLSRSLPEGGYDLYVSGNAFLKNAGDTDDAKFDTNKYTVDGFIKVVTPAPDKGENSASKQKVVFTIGDANYTVGDETKVAQTAPFINKDGRTMVAIKELAYAVGVSEANINWDHATKTATILGDRIVQVKAGSDQLLINGAVIRMNTKAEIKNGRMFIPVSYVASALNVPYTWDHETKTVIFNN